MVAFETIVHVMNNPGSCTRGELKTIVGKTEKSLGHLDEEIKRGELTSFVFIN
jgi:hypothetical protein